MFGSTGSGVNQFQVPDSICVSPAGQIYVGDSINARIVRIDDMAGTGWTTFGSSGGGINQFGSTAAVFVQ